MFRITFSFLAVFLAQAALVFSNSADTKLFFVETFDNGDPFASGKWVKSEDPKYADQPVLVKPSGIPARGFESDNGVLLSKELKYYGFGSKFPTPFDMKEHKELVIQYELKLEETLNCGGAYVKLPRVSDSLDFSHFNSDTPYTIMFGPDKCGSANNKVHFIVQHQNPLTSLWEEKHFNDTSAVKMDKKTHLYTLVLRDDNTFTTYLDKVQAKSGSLLTHLVPPINPPKEIDDPTDSKPADWVDVAEIDDPTATKPDDWDETAPKMILDPAASKPSSWLDDAPARVPDPSAVKPSDWDDEEDGDWEAPTIDNPDCEKFGCGEWKHPTIKNPAYKGIWKAPRIPNPAYKGPWKARQIPNEHYFHDANPAKSLAPIAGLVVEVWTITAGIFFDNFVVADSLDAAFAFADKTFVKKSQAESQKEKKEKKEKNKAQYESIKQTGSTKEKLEVYLIEMAEFVEENLAMSIISMLLVIAGAVFMFGGGSSNNNKLAAVQRGTRREMAGTSAVSGVASTDSLDSLAATSGEETVAGAGAGAAGAVDGGEGKGKEKTESVETKSNEK